MNLIEKYCENEAAGGTCHILLEDENYDSAKSCKKFAEKLNDIWGYTIASILCEFTEEEIEEICERPWEIKERYWDKGIIT